jgi:hypothetical protein
MILFILVSGYYFRWIYYFCLQGKTDQGCKSYWLGTRWVVKEVMEDKRGQSEIWWQRRRIGLRWTSQRHLSLNGQLFQDCEE